MRTTILGSQLRRLARTTINGLAQGRQIPVQFRGTGAYTTGKMVSLPKINDLAEIVWSVAKAILGYGIHEVGHVRLTDFDQVVRSAILGQQIQHFTNAIEDYRIERDMVALFKGAREDLTAMRNAIHPAPDRFPPQWFADPRKCGALALTWTGSQLNNFNIPAMAATLNEFPQPVMIMLDRWTARMKDITSTREAVDLAIEFVAEAEAYADAMKSAAQEQNDDAGDDTGDQDQSQNGDNGEQPGSDSSEPGDQDQATDDAAKNDGEPASGDKPQNDSETTDEAGKQTDFDNAIDPSAALEDLLDQLAPLIAKSVAETGAPDDQALADDGEVCPDTINDAINEANAAAPAYDTSDAEEAQDSLSGHEATNNAYSSSAIEPVVPDGNGEYLNDLTGKAAGTIANTARVIKRVLMATEQRGVLRNRRSGDFDIRNLGAIVRNTGTIYKKTWERPSPRTLLVTLTDFSGSMSGNKIDLAMTGTLALLRATKNTPVTNWIYGYTGYSPNVALYEIAGPKTPDAMALRRIDSAGNLTMRCTPTGEAMAEAIKLMDLAEEDRRVLLVLTDGDADNEDLCKATVSLAARRGIEVIAIGIQSQSVARWAPNYEVLSDINALPDALLRTIDPRQTRKKAA